MSIRPSTSDALRAEVDRGWRTFRDAVRGLGRGGQDDATGAGWTFHDLIAHVAAWEAHAAVRLRGFQRTGAPVPFEGDVDTLNAAFIASHKLVGPEALLDELDSSHRRLLEEIARLDDGQLAAHDSWAAMVIAVNAFEHYADHARELA